MISNDPVVSALNEAMNTINSLETSYHKAVNELNETKIRLAAALKVTLDGAPLFVDYDEAARLMAISRRTVIRLVQSGKLTATKFQGAARIRRSDIEQLAGEEV